VFVESRSSTRKFLAGLICLSLLMGLSIGFSRVATTLYALELDAHGWNLAAVAFAQSIGMLVLGFSAGKWVSEYGTRPVFIFGTLWGALIYLATPLVPNLWALLVFSAAASLAMPLRFVSINTVFMSRLDDIGQQRAGWFRASHIIGMSFLGAVFATTLFPISGALPVFWIAAAIFLLNILTLLLAFSPEDLGRAKITKSSSASAMISDSAARKVAFWEFIIQSLNAYYAFYIVVIVVRYLQLPAETAGFAVAIQGVSFVSTLITFGSFALRHRRSSPVIGASLVMVSLVMLALSEHQSAIFGAAALLGFGLGLLQIINLTQFARLGARIGYHRAASINALSGPSGGIVGGALGGIFESWMSPQTTFCIFLPLFLILILAFRSNEE
jgi:MFS family permease